MATCAECGSENPDDSRFCGNCGKPLAAAEQPGAAPPEEPAAAPPPAGPPATPPPADPGSAPTTEQPGSYTPQHAAYNEALAAINTSSESDAPTTEAPAAATPPVTTTPPVAPIPTSPPPTETMPPATGQAPPTSTMPPTVVGSGGGSNKKVFAIIGGVVALLAIVAAVWFFVLRDDSEPGSNIGLNDDSQEETTEEEGAEEEGAEEEDAVDPGADPADPALFDSIEPFVAQSAGPYSITQSSSDPCEPPCIFPPEAHPESLETYQATWDAGSPESEIFGEFLRYPSETEALTGVASTIDFLESSGYAEVDTFSIGGVPGTVYQSPDSEILLYQESNLMMGLFGNKGYPIEFVGYLGP